MLTKRKKNHSTLKLSLHLKSCKWWVLSSETLMLSYFPGRVYRCTWAALRAPLMSSSARMKMAPAALWRMAWTWMGTIPPLSKCLKVSCALSFLTGAVFSVAIQAADKRTRALNGRLRCPLSSSEIGISCRGILCVCQGRQTVKAERFVPLWKDSICQVCGFPKQVWNVLWFSHINHM